MLSTGCKHVIEKGMLRKLTSLFSRTWLSWLLYGPTSVSRIMICTPSAVLAMVYAALS